MSEITRWPDARLSVDIDYSCDVLESIRQTAIQGLVDLPKIGLGFGGLLLGRRDDQRITILGSRELACSHAFGPAFSLTAEELSQARDTIAEDSSVIGWYFSKGLRPLELTDSDRAMLGVLFPTQWDLGMLVQPHMVRPARIRFFGHNAAGIMIEGEPDELAAWHEEVLKSAALPETVAEPVLVSPPVGRKDETEPHAVESRAVEPLHIVSVIDKPAEPVKVEPVIVGIVTGRREIAPRSLVPGHREQVVHRQVVAKRRRASEGKWLEWAVAVIVFLAVLTTRALLHRDSEPAPLALESTDTHGTLVIRWNNDAVRDMEQAFLFIDDGGRLHTVSLNRSQLDSGVLLYPRKFARVTATMSAGKAQGVTSFAAPAVKRKQTPPIPLPYEDPYFEKPASGNSVPENAPPLFEP